MTTKRITLNALSASTQVLFVGIAYFVLYKYLLKTVGIEQLGVWALILSTSSIATLANFGITSGLVKFVADYNARGKFDEIPRLIYTALISMATFYLSLIILIYFFASFIISHIVAKQFISLALQILPFSLISLLINELGSVFTSILEGYQRNYIRNIIYITSTAIFLLLTFLLVPHYNLIGVAYAQVIQSLLVFCAGLIAGSKVCKGLNLLRWQWDKSIFKQLVSYGSKFQLVSLLQMLYEPTTKVLLAKFGGLSTVGYYEMASRLVNQVRGLIVNANQVMIPVVAHASHAGIEAVKKLYEKTISITLFISSFVIAGIISLGSIISVLWIGHYEPVFVFSLNVLAIGVFFNIICGPSYFSSLGEGELNLLVYAHITMAMLNILLGYILGLGFSGQGVIVSWALTLSVGSIMIIWGYNKKLKIDIKELFVLNDRLLFFATLLYSFILLYFYWNFKSANSVYWLLAKSIALLLIIFIPLIAVNKNIRIIKSLFSRSKS